MKKILFICTGNSARSVMAEVLTNELGRDRYKAYSAGAKPSGEVNPLTIEILKAHGHSVEGLRSKPLTGFLDKDFDIVVTVCDNARETCPVFPGRARLIHRNFDDPPHLAENAGSEEEVLQIYRRVCDEIREFVEQLPIIL